MLDINSHFEHKTGGIPIVLCVMYESLVITERVNSEYIKKMFKEFKGHLTAYVFDIFDMNFI